MTLTDNGKDWVAANIGSGNCISHSSMSFTYRDIYADVDRSDSGSSATMMNRLNEPDLVEYVTFGGSRLYYSSFTSANGGGASDDDVRWINNNDWCVGDGGDGDGGEPGGTTCPTPTASFTFTPSSPKQGDQVTFRPRAGSGGSGATVTDYRWDYGDGESGTSNYHVYRRTGSFTVRLTVTNSCGNTQSATRRVSVSSTAPGDGGSGTDCTPGDRECVDDTHYRRCDSQGHWGRSIRCASGNVCVGAGVCAPESSGGNGGGPGLSGKEVGPFEVTIGSGSACPPGDPPFSIDISGAYAYSSADPRKYVAVGGINITNPHSSCFAYYTWVTKLWDGSGYSSCPSASPQAEDVSRYFGDDGSASMTRQKIEPGDTEVLFATLEIPTSMTGTKTLCLYLWGNFSKEALTNELRNAGYAE